MSTRLETILESTRARVVTAKTRVSETELERKAAAHRPRGWARALGNPPPGVAAIIAEVKKASPSRGLIRQDFDVAWISRRYESGGAAALSVLTDEPFFQGSLENLEIASASTRLPCLRKDFMVDEYQILEARAHHADAILLIAAALSREELKTFAARARELSLDVLVEVHTASELEDVLDTLGDRGADAIGVNNRDLKTFDVRMETSLELVDRIPSSVIRVAESGITKREDIERLRAAGFNALLIGESLMRAPDPGAALAELAAVAPRVAG
jgi:indole-3-glycerol phosphate synthase